MRYFAKFNGGPMEGDDREVYSPYLDRPSSELYFLIPAAHSPPVEISPSQAQPNDNIEAYCLKGEFEESERTYLYVWAEPKEPEYA